MGGRFIASEALEVGPIKRGLLHRFVVGSGCDA